MKKRILILFITIVSSASMNAQDIMTMKNGEEIKAKITEIGTAEIKYKKYDNPDGPIMVVSKADVFMIKYENGTKDVFGQSSVAVNSSNTKKVSEKKYRALIYLGLSVPMGPFGSTTSNEGGAAKIGGTLGHEGDVMISNNSVYFTYNINATLNPYEIASSNGYETLKLSGNYGLFYGLAGFKFKSYPSDNRFYGLIAIGINGLTITGDIAEYSSVINGYKFKFETTGGSSVTFCGGVGLEIKHKLNFGIRYFNSKPKFTSTATYSGPYGFQEKYEGEQKVGVLQVLFGYMF